MSKYKLYIQESEPSFIYDQYGPNPVRCQEPGPPHYYVRATSRKLVVFGPKFDSVDEAFAQLRKCEQDEEYAYWQSVYCLGKRPNPREDAPMRDMTKYEKVVLNFLFSKASEYYGEDQVQTFYSLANALTITERQAKTACRQLKRRGYAEHTAYWNCDGMLGGSGYMISMEGMRFVRYRPSQFATTSHPVLENV